MAARRYWLLLALAALLVAAPMVRCQAAEDADDDSDEPEIVTGAPAAKPAVPAGSLDQYKALALKYVNQATEIGKVYVSQAQEIAAKYLGQAQDVAAPYLEKAGIKVPSKKIEL